ncbi:MAG: rhodanese-like domain-containing protein [Candidatus Izemoplasma sp.]|nr:rhodanese-like domain-containing protein [Candidatus Izemoplasma sp.]
MPIKVVYIVFIIMLISSCDNQNDEIEDITPASEITMANLDQYMYRTDVQYVDLRNFDAKFQSGYIESFTQIPFFDYLDNRVVKRDNTFEFQPDHIIDETEIRRLFDKNKAIFMFDDGCIRSGYMKDVLQHLGYTRVFVLGGFYEYDGVYKMLGDGQYTLGNTFYQDIIKDSSYHYYMYGHVDMDKKITDIRFDITDANDFSLRSNEDNNAFDYHYRLIAFEEEILSSVVTLYELQEALIQQTGPMYDVFILLDSSTQTAILELLAYELNN